MIIEKTRSGDRFIPARAGNAWVNCRQTPDMTVHPRACGERYAERQVCAMNAGSSPRVRGTPTARIRKLEKERFIPARAGNADRTS